MRTRFGTVPDNAGDLPDRSHQGAFDDLFITRSRVERARTSPARKIRETASVSRTCTAPSHKSAATGSIEPDSVAL